MRCIETKDLQTHYSANANLIKTFFYPLLFSPCVKCKHKNFVSMEICGGRSKCRNEWPLKCYWYMRHVTSNLQAHLSTYIHTRQSNTFNMAFEFAANYNRKSTLWGRFASNACITLWRCAINSNYPISIPITLCFRVSVCENCSSFLYIWQEFLLLKQSPFKVLQCRHLYMRVRCEFFALPKQFFRWNSIFLVATNLVNFRQRPKESTIVFNAIAQSICW